MMIDPEWINGLAGRRRLGILDPGEPLAEVDRAGVNPFVGDATDIRIHRDERAGMAAARMGADAFALGRHVFFAPGRYAPETPSGQALLAHELVHARQPATGPALQRQEDHAQAAERAVLAARGGAAGGLAVGSFRRQYAADRGQIVPEQQAWLDAVSLRALAVAEELLGPASLDDAALERIEIEVRLDPSSGAEAAARAWGRAIADAVLRQLPGTTR